MVADDGTFSGTSEAVFILGLLSNKLQAPATTNPCQQFYTGTLLGQSVVVAISGYLSIYGSSDQSADMYGLTAQPLFLKVLRLCRYWS